MLLVTDRIAIPDDEFRWTFARSGGPGGQNVNKVASKVTLHWDLAGSPSLADDVKARLRAAHPGKLTTMGELVISSQLTRDQGRNRDDCLEKLREMIRRATIVPRPRKKTRPTRGSQEARLRSKRHRSAAKGSRRTPSAD
jgi:ribosome-associated protein